MKKYELHRLLLLLVVKGGGEPRVSEVPNFRHLIYVFKLGTKISFAVGGKVPSEHLALKHNWGALTYPWELLAGADFSRELSSLLG